MPVTFQGKPVDLCGPQLRVGDSMPDFTLMDNGLQPVHGSDLHGVRLFLTVPSLDTGVCDQEVRRFNQAAGEFPDARVYAVSLDLPFAQARWCGAAGIKAVQTLSDYRDHSFGKATGTRIEQLGLLTRAVFLVDPADRIVYAEYVPEITEHPAYDAVLHSLRTLFS